MIDTSPTPPPTPAPSPIDSAAPTAAPIEAVDPITTVFDPNCVRRVQPDDTLEGIARMLGGPDSLRDLWVENGFPTTLTPGELIDVCPANGLDDVHGGAQMRAAHPEAIAALGRVVVDQQEKLNELLTPYGSRPLKVDGEPGPSTGQRLCAFRLLTGGTPSIEDMAPASTEMATLMATTELHAPSSPVLGAARWVLIDQTCQMMFIGEGNELVYIFPTSTGEPGNETRNIAKATAFRYDPAPDNNGWHDSSQYPVGVDNPLNGNLYKPVFFNYGQAIHGAGRVPATPASKGCARLTVGDQDTFVKWLGLSGRTEETWHPKDIGLVVSVQGAYVERD